MSENPDTNAVHLQRDRAESFGAVAADYDRYRPSYPDSLLDDIAARAGAEPLLDVGCGTGKAAVALRARGCDVLGVEIDDQMAEVARGHGVPVEVGSFETWDDAGRTFEVITAAQAWHWVDPAVGVPKLARLLRPGGVFMPFWNSHDLDGDELAVATEVYRRLEPGLVPSSGLGRPGTPVERSPYFLDLQTYGSFASLEESFVEWVETVPVADWAARVSTHSDHLALGSERLAAVRAGLTEALAALGPTVHLVGGTYLITAQV